jgi:hypothetical protein
MGNVTRDGPLDIEEQEGSGSVELVVATLIGVVLEH